ncbi:hypothetical protein GW17_00047483 [Ensete ventricosum]|nr:hypothetical protein GW17_00047483 [Ensete ventricosum]
MAENGVRGERGSLAPLLDIDESSRVSEELLEWEPVPCNARWRLAVWESKNLWRLSWASIVIQLFNFMLSLVTQMFVGHLGSLDLAGASIINVGVQGLAFGIMVSPFPLNLSTHLTPPRFTDSNLLFIARDGERGANTLVLHLVAAVLLGFLYWFSGPLLRAIGQSDSIAKVGQLYARGLLPQLIAFALYCPMQRFLQAQNIVNPMAYIAVGVLLFHILISWLAVFVLNFGLLGASLTLSFSWWVLVVVTWSYIIFSPSCKETWTGLSMKAFRGLWPYFKLTLSSAIMLLGVHVVLLQCQLLELGLHDHAGVEQRSQVSEPKANTSRAHTPMNRKLQSIASCSVRIGNELGAAHPRVAKFAVIVVVTTSLIISLFVSVLVMLLRTPLSKLYTNSTDVIKAVINLTPLLAISIFLNGVQPILSGLSINWHKKDSFMVVLSQVDKAIERLKHTSAAEDTLAITDIE